MENEPGVPKRNISIASAVVLLCAGSVALLISRIKHRRERKVQQELNKSLTD